MGLFVATLRWVAAEKDPPWRKTVRLPVLVTWHLGQHRLHTGKVAADVAVDRVSERGHGAEEIGLVLHPRNGVPTAVASGMIIADDGGKKKRRCPMMAMAGALIRPGRGMTDRGRGGSRHLGMV